MAITTAGSSTSGAALDASLPIIYKEFRILLDETGVMRSCATAMPLLPHEGSTKYINNYGRVQAYGVDDGADIAQAQALADTATGYTPSEVAAQVILSGRTMDRVADAGLQSRTAQILANAIDLKMDSDGCVALQSYTTTGLGSAGTVISPGHISGAAARVMIGNNRTNPEPPAGDIFTVIHPLSAHVLSLRLQPFATTPAGGTAAGVNTGAHLAVSNTVSSLNDSDIVKRGYKAIGMLGNSIVKTDANIHVDANDDMIGATFAKSSLIFVSEKDPQLKWDTSDVSMRGAAEGNAWASYVWGLYRASAWGNTLTFDASLPTS